jgi:hypothetical protein
MVSCTKSKTHFNDAAGKRWILQRGLVCNRLAEVVAGGGSPVVLCSAQRVA